MTSKTPSEKKTPIHFTALKCSFLFFVLCFAFSKDTFEVIFLTASQWFLIFSIVSFFGYVALHLHSLFGKLNAIAEKKASSKT